MVSERRFAFQILLWTLLGLTLFPAGSLAQTKEDVAAIAAADALLSEKRYAEAARAYEQAATTDPENVLAWFSAGEAWLEAKDPENAKRAFLKATKFASHEILSYQRLAAMAARAGNAEETAQWLNRALDRGAFPYRILFSEDFDGVRNSPAFQRVIDRHARLPFPVLEGYSSWSPDGSWIVFDANYDGAGSTDLYVASADGTRLRRLTKTNGAEMQPAWSPNSDEILFVKQGDPYRAYGIFSIRADGTGEKLVLGSHSKERLHGNYVHPRWFPDGRRFVFLSDASGFLQVYVGSTDGMKPRQISDTPRAKSNPTVLNDGKTICYDVEGPPEVNDYRIVCVSMDDTAHPQVIAHTNWWWAPNSFRGQMKLAVGFYETPKSRFSQLGVMDATGRNARVITPATFDAFWPSVSPDGKTIAFSLSRNPFSSDRRLYIINTDGTGLRKLLPTR